MIAVAPAMVNPFQPGRNSPPAILLRESYREGRKVRKRTLSGWPAAHIEGLRAFTVIRTLPHGHVAAAPSAGRASRAYQAALR